jgi:hypothetical protein
MPNEAKDMMSYCGPEWVSDYTYEALLQDQLRMHNQADNMPAADGMLIRATLDKSDKASFQPIYSRIPVVHSLPPESERGDSPYVFELAAADGSIIATYPAELLEAGEEGVSARMLSAAVPMNDAVASLRLVHLGQVVAQQTLANGNGTELQSASESLVVERSISKIRLSWGLSDQPALVRYSANGGQSWMVLAVDVTGGQMVIDTDQLPDDGQGEFQIIPGNSAEPLILTTSTVK